MALAAEHYENFPVGSVLVPRHLRHHIHRIYAFARTADDIADELRDPALLAAYRQSFLDHLAGKVRDEIPLHADLALSIEQLNLPVELFTDLLDAFAQDLRQGRYDQEGLFDYCRRSADPVGRLVLLVFGCQQPELAPLSDRICTGLQLVNHLQDIKADIEKAVGVDVEAIAGPGVEHTSSTIPIKYRDRLYIKDKPGYYMAWGGENEDSIKGRNSIAGSVPIFFGIMVFIIIALFNSIRKTLVIWLTVPLAIIGVTVGLLLFKEPFGFMSMLGFMSLAGMLIKNAIVLVDQIGIELDTGKEPISAIVDSGVSRLIPVSMAALTTILGMIPLLGDAFFVGMAVTIMFGLGFATVLTLVVVPVLYATIFGFKTS